MKNDELREQTLHGNLLFPLQVYFIEGISNTYYSHYHWHDEIEIIYMKKGKCEFMIDGKETDIEEGQALFINSGSIHTRYRVFENDCEYYAIVFNHELLASSSFDTCQSKYISPFKEGQYDLSLLIPGDNIKELVILEEVSNIIDCFSNKLWGFELSIKASLFRIFSILLSEGSLKSKDCKPALNVERNKNLLKQIIRYIESNYQKDMDLKDISSQVHLSKYYLCRTFKRLTGKTIMDYLNQYRINQAVILLKDVDKKIIDISLEVGFGNVSYFIKIFKKNIGCTPLKFRNNM